MRPSSVTSRARGTVRQSRLYEEFYRQDKNGNVDAIYAKLINDSPAVMQARANLQQVKSDLDQALLNLRYTSIRAPFPGVVVKRYRHLGDFASPGVAILSMYNPDLIYVTANLEETRLPGVAPGNPVELQVDAFAEPFHGRVVWINKSTGAQFALMPRNVVSGEFTKVVQRVPVRIAIEKDERWPLLRAGLSVRAVIAHGEGDPQWAEQAAREMRDLEDALQPAAAPGATGPIRGTSHDCHASPRRTAVGARTCTCSAGPAAAARAPPLAGGPGGPLRLLRALPDPRADRHSPTTPCGKASTSMTTT